MEFWQGVAASLVASILGAVLLWAVSKFGVPAVRSFLWRGTDISGSWHSYDTDPASGVPVGDAEIKQSGSDVSMQLHRHKNRSGEATSRRYRYHGRFSSRVLTLLWESFDRPDYIIGALVLYLHADGRQFQGLTIYFDDTAGKINTYEFWLRRPKT